MKRKCRLIFALDVAKKKEFLRWIDATKDLIDFYKVGLVPFTALGPDAITLLKRRKKKVFLDLKLFDIPNTMTKACVNAMKHNVDIIDFHLLAGKDSLRTTLEGIRKEARRKKLSMPLTLGVTILTSTANKSKIKTSVMKLAQDAHSAGLDGVVLSGKEAHLVRKRLGPGFVLACPGIRLGGAKDDQKRVVTPRQVKSVADFIIVGRPIYEAKEPRKIVHQILEELK